MLSVKCDLYCLSSEPGVEDVPVLLEDKLGALAAYVAERASGKGAKE